MTGTISINTRQRGQTPKKVPNMPQRATGKAWNQALREVGFDYGEGFQDMQDIRSDGKNFVASSKTVIKQESGTMEGESRHGLHPGTVDSTLQLIIVSIYAGRVADMGCGAVPIQVDEVAIWPPTKERLEKSTAKVFSWTDKRGIRSFQSGSQLIVATVNSSWTSRTCGPHTTKQQSLKGPTTQPRASHSKKWYGSSISIA